VRVDPESADAFVVRRPLRDSALQRAIIDAAARTVVVATRDRRADPQGGRIRTARRENFGALAKC